MRDFAKISPKFWIQGESTELHHLNEKEKLLALYLLTSPHSNMLGIYYLPISYASNDTGMAEQDVIHALNKLQDIDFCAYDDKNKYVWVYTMAKSQIDEMLNVNDNRVKAINDIFQQLPSLEFVDVFFETYKDAFHLKKREPKPASQFLLLKQKNILSTRKFTGCEEPSKGLESPLEAREKREVRREKGEKEGLHRTVLWHKAEESYRKNNPLIFFKNNIFQFFQYLNCRESCILLFYCELGQFPILHLSNLTEKSVDWD